MTGASIQDYLFQRIREKLSPEESLADRVATLLNVSSDSAYRRIRGETPLVLSEASLLCKAFDISLDQALGNSGQTLSFELVRLQNEDNGFQDYLEQILTGLERLNEASEKEIIYLSKDIPIFHNFHFRPVFAFHYFFWMKSIQQHPGFMHRKFSMNLLTPELERAGKKILQVYNALPSTEIWNTECVNSMISQVEYYREAGYFENSEDAEKVYQALAETIEHLRQQAESGCKFLPGESPRYRKNQFDFFHNRVILGDNTIVATADGRRQVYLNHDTLNYMITSDEEFCNSVHARIRNLIRRSTILSQTSEKQRNIFFNTLLRKIPRHQASNHF